MPSLFYVTENHGNAATTTSLWNLTQFPIGFATGKNKIKYSPHNSIFYISDHIAGPSFRILGEFWSALTLRIIVYNETIKVITEKPSQTEVQHHTCLAMGWTNGEC